MPLWESNEIYLVAGLSVLVTLGVFASLAYFLYKRTVANGRRADEEQAALEKVLLRKEAVPTSSSPPTKPLIVSPSFSSPNKVPARHLRSGSYSPTHYLSPYHSRQPRRNSSPTSHVQHPKLPQITLHPSQPQLEEEDTDHEPAHSQENTGNLAGTGSHVAPAVNANGNGNENAIVAAAIKTDNDNENRGQEKHNKNGDKMRENNNGNRNNVAGSLALHNSQYYGTIPSRRMGRLGVVAPAESNLAANMSGAFIPMKCGTGAAIIPHLKNNSFIKSEYVQLPGKDEADYTKQEDHWKCKDDNSENSKEKMNKWKNCSDADEGSLRRKLLLQKQYQQKLQLQQQHSPHHRLSTQQPPGELFQMKHSVTEEIPYYISTQ